MEFSKPSVKALRERLDESMFSNSVIKPILEELGDKCQIRECQV